MTQVVAARRALEEHARVSEAPAQDLIDGFHRRARTCTLADAHRRSDCRTHALASSVKRGLTENLASNVDEASAAVALLLRREKARIVELLEQTLNELAVKADCPTLRTTVEEEQAAEAECALKSSSIKVRVSRGATG
jgi:hypothetical protein